MKITLNGRASKFEKGACVRDAVSLSGHATNGRGVAVALNGEVVPRSTWNEVVLREGDVLEILVATQGG